MKDKRPVGFRPTLRPDAKSTLDFFVSRGVVSYSGWDEIYFYLDKNGEMVILDFALDEWFNQKD